jgi:hypothetical protein
MICKHCGKETANVICDNCGINAVWYNKYGYQHDIDNPGELAQYDVFIPDKNTKTVEIDCNIDLDIE